MNQVAYNYDPKRANIGRWIGKIIDTPQFSHSTRTKDGVIEYYQTQIEIKRKSDVADTLLVIFDKAKFPEIQKGNQVCIKGSFRSKNMPDKDKKGRSKLLLYIYPRFAELVGDGYQEANGIFDPNFVKLDGYICKKPNKRETPYGKEITDILLAVNRPTPSSDYIPVIIWGQNAINCAELPVGTRVIVKGRIQSRNYKKKLEDGTIVDKVAYEVSGGRIIIAE